MTECDSYNQQRLADRAECQPGGSATSATIEEVEEVMLDSLRARDYLIMQTENSVYRLTMLEPAARLGLLSGGKLGSRGIEVTLVATTPVSVRGRSRQVMTLKRNSRALFAIASEDGVEHFITSVIMKLTQVKGRQVAGPTADC